MIAVVDYGVGNLYSLTCSLNHIGADSVVTRGAEQLQNADKIILPGVGAFGDAADKLRALRLDTILRDLAALGKPLLGVCLGMQLLFEKSFEYGEHAGLGLIRGNVRDMTPQVGNRKVPHMGWNSLDFKQPDDPLLKDIGSGDFVYFVHSFYASDCEDALVATADYGVAVPAIVRSGNVCGTQFHPEKSGGTGLKILAAFAKGA